MSQPVSVLFSRDEISARVASLGARIAQDQVDGDPVLVAVLKGSAVFLADLVRAIPAPLSVDFMSISRFGGAQESLGRVQILKDLDIDITGRHVILVEDIVDTGLTLTYLLDVLRQRRPASLEVCALLDKSARRIVDVEVRYAGFECPDRFVVGYGLDLDERWRNLDRILAVEDVAAARRDPSLIGAFLAGRDGSLPGGDASP